jgi:hypothetical protein
MAAERALGGSGQDATNVSQTCELKQSRASPTSGDGTFLALVLWMDIGEEYDADCGAELLSWTER